MSKAPPAPSGFGFRPAVVGDVAGGLELTVARTGHITSPVRTRGGGVLRLMQPLYLDDSGQLTYMIVNPGGAYFGERYRLNVDVGERAHLLVSSQGATRIHRTPKEPAEATIEFALRAGCRFEYLPDQTIAYRDADFRQMTTIRAAPDAQGFFGEIVTPGWDPNGERFTYAGVHMRTAVVTESGDRPVCIDNTKLKPASLGGAIGGIGHLEGRSHLGSVMILGGHVGGEHVQRVRDTVEALGLDDAGVTAGQRHGVAWLLVRALADSTDHLNAMILAVNEVDRAVTTGQQRVDLRRY